MHANSDGRPMKRAELLQHAQCSLCHKPIGNSGLPLFWRVKIERFGVDLRAVQRQDALGVLVGNQALGAIMGPDQDMATPMQEHPTVVTVCETCSTAKDMPVAAMAEHGRPAC